jgi:hypothetical protein
VAGRARPTAEVRLLNLSGPISFDTSLPFEDQFCCDAQLGLPPTMWGRLGLRPEKGDHKAAMLLGGSSAVALLLAARGASTLCAKGTPHERRQWLPVY